MRILITGGCGFIGHHMVEHLIENSNHQVLILDGLNYAGRVDRLAKYRNHPRVHFWFHNLRAPISDMLAAEINPDWIIHSAAETHVDQSLKDPLKTVESNVLGTYNILDAAIKWHVKKFLYVSTDEVFGPAPEGVDYKEDDRFSPSNPYSATKAAGECLTMAWATSYGLPILITRTMNNFGERQHPEKYIPMTIRNVMQRQVVRIHGNGKVTGSRKWLHARNHADGVQFLLENNANGTYHIAGEEHDNLEMAERIARILEIPLHHEIVDANKARPGHDLRYSLDDKKIKALGWTPKVDFEESLTRTVLWTENHPKWL